MAVFLSAQFATQDALFSREKLSRHVPSVKSMFTGTKFKSATLL